MLLQRTLTALLLAPLALAIILLPPNWLFAVIVGVVFLASAWEWSRLCGLRAPVARALWLLAPLACMLALWWLRAQLWLWTLGIVLGVSWWLLSLWWLRRYSFAAAPTPANATMKLILGVLVFVPAWLALTRLHGGNQGQWWTLLAVLVVWAADTGAYFSGRFLGRRKLAPRISPGKTWAGVYGALALGAVVCTLGAWLLHVRTPGALLGMFILGMLTVAASIIGDLLESLLKRQSGIKDSGALFPGHGGLLDRLDSVFAALPVFVVGLMVLGL